MSVDHSLTYKKFSLRNIIHIVRFFMIKRTSQIVFSDLEPESYADFGCSNGYITKMVADLIKPKQAFGFDYSSNLAIASKNYPEIQFNKFDLTKSYVEFRQFEAVTCFETLEHVGDLNQAVKNLLGAVSNGGRAIITVPIEIGFFGMLKFVIKRFIYRYPLPLSVSSQKYFWALLLGENISEYREPAPAYSSHFGFDYRVVNKLINNSHGFKYRSFNFLGTRYYLLESVG
jgi:2-polyprenyl-3-methyl-5-hydroxy-6-metoxy-1,4-benzoquinol methylase